MDGDNERPRAEPSIRDDDIEGLDAPKGQTAPVDLERLFAELDNTGMPAPVSDAGADVTAPRDSARAASGIVAEDFPAQPAFDFGEGDEPVISSSATARDSYSEPLSNGEEPMSRNLLMAGGALAALSLLLGAVGLFTAFNASSRIDELQQSVDALTQRIATLQVSGDPRVGQLQAEQAGITSRLDEMAMRLDGSAAEAETPALAELRKRLDALERKPSPQVVKNTTATGAAPKKTAAKPAPAAGDWTVILVSFATAAQADSEKSRLQKLGIRSEVSKSVVDGKPRYRLRVPGYASQEKAKAAIPAIESKSGIKGAWVAQR